MREMKPCTVGKINTVPKSWETIPLKYLFKFNKGLSITKEDLVEDGIKVINYGQVHSKANSGTTLSEDLIRYVEESHSTDNRASIAPKGGFIFADTSEDLDGCGNCAYVDTDDLVFGGYHTIVMSPTKTIDNKYLAYLFRTDAWRYQIRKQLTEVKVYSISQKVLKSTMVILPPTEEQSSIVSFLDKRCDNIDKAIERHKAIIDAANQLRISIISQAVTRGITSEPLVDSGIAWASKIPQSWTKGKLKYLTTIKTAKADNDNLPYIALENVESCTMQYVSSESEYDPSAAVTCAKGDILFGKLRPYLSKVFILPYDACCSNEFMVFSDFQGEPDYLKYLLVSNGFIDTVNGSTYGAKMPRANPNFIKNMFIPVPPVEEQKKIAEFLDEKCEALNQAIIKREAIINKLEEYRKSLIYNAVTGKIDCTEEQ